MNLTTLKTFVTVVDEGNFSKASEKLHLSQPAVSMQMQSLSREIGVEIFLRVGKRVHLTDAGKILYSEAENILKLWHRVENQLSSYQKQVSGKLKLGASTIPGQYYLPKFVKSFKRDVPKGEISVILGDSNWVIDSVSLGELDIGFVGKRVKSKEITSCRWMKDKLVAIASTDYPYDNIKNARELQKVPMVLRKKGSATREVLVDNLRTHFNLGINDLNIVMESNGTEGIISAVEANLGISFISEVAAKRAESSGAIKIVKCPMEVKRDLYYIFRKGHEGSNIFKIFLNHLAKGGNKVWTM
ncbi:selenium metabolism-associated LysR family transcriptional regulator [Proteinivorax hydrogeniformans]|uniref:Selenium metabolism-associated LysR family transcriptional regulator n=1 Tax=Proteinivorax hydrogeniformans TaxID=1826727 RepID=A0AAU8HSA2_9FIRM